MITLKELTNIEELEQLEIIEQNVWGMESLPVHQTLTAVKWRDNCRCIRQQ